MQQPGINFDCTWAPVVSAQSMRMFFALSTQFDLEIYQMDVSRAFLNSPIDKEIYVIPPSDHGYINKVFKLKRAIPGLKQAEMLWHREIDKSLKKLGFKTIKSDPCVYINNYTADDPQFMAVLLVVDDLLIISRNLPNINRAKIMLKQSYVMKDLGHVEKYCGFEIQRDLSKGTLRLHQQADILHWAENEAEMNLKCEASPMDPKTRFFQSTNLATEDQIKKYQRAIGFLHY